MLHYIWISRPVFKLKFLNLSQLAKRAVYLKQPTAVLAQQDRGRKNAFPTVLPRTLICGLEVAKQRQKKTGKCLKIYFWGIAANLRYAWRHDEHTSCTPKRWKSATSCQHASWKRWLFKAPRHPKSPLNTAGLGAFGPRITTASVVPGPLSVVRPSLCCILDCVFCTKTKRPRTRTARCHSQVQPRIKSKSNKTKLSTGLSSS